MGATKQTPLSTTTTLVLLLTLLRECLGRPSVLTSSYALPPQSYSMYNQGHPPPKPYQYSYGVQDKYHGTNFGHEENSNGKAVTGRYYVDLPDGRRQIVTYIADHHRGYMATITYENVGFKQQYPTPPSHYSPAPSHYSPSPAPSHYSSPSMYRR